VIYSNFKSFAQIYIRQKLREIFPIWGIEPVLNDIRQKLREIFLIWGIEPVLT